MGTTQSTAPAGTRLDSWKEISTYLKRDPRTVQRWEKKEGLPVHRHVHESQASVYAYTSELDAWLTSRTISNGNGDSADQSPNLRGRLFLWVSVGTAAVLITATLLLVVFRRERASLPTVRTFRQVWNGDEVDYWDAVSPDGRYVSFTDLATGDLSVRDLGTRANSHITNGLRTRRESAAWVFNAVFSPDSKSLAYWCWTDDRTNEVRTIGLDGSRQRTLLHDPDKTSYVLMDWSPDGKLIAAVIERSNDTRELALISARDGTIRTLKRFGRVDIQRVAFSRNGRYIAYDASTGSDGTSDIFLISLDSTENRRIIDYPTNEILIGWSPRGEALIFASDRTGTNGVWQIAIKDGKTQGDPQLLKGDIGPIFPLAISRSGAIFSLLDVGLADVFVAELGSKNPPVRVSERFVGARTHPDFSPDGTRLLYQASRGSAGAALYVRSLDSGREIAIHPQLRSFMNPHWDPHDGGILITGTDGTTTGTWRVEPANGAARLVESGPPKKYFKPPEGMRGPGEPYPSPDGATILQAFRGFPKGYNSLLLIPTKGGEPRQLVRLQQPEKFPSGAFAWSPDHRYVYFPRKVDSVTELFRIPVAGGQIEPTGLRAPSINYLSIHPDGKRVAFQEGESKVELWALDGFLASK